MLFLDFAEFLLLLLLGQSIIEIFYLISQRELVKLCSLIPKLVILTLRVHCVCYGTSIVPLFKALTVSKAFSGYAVSFSFHLNCLVNSDLV